MLLCQNAQTFNLEGSLVSSPQPRVTRPSTPPPPPARELTGFKKDSLQLGLFYSLQKQCVCITEKIAENKNKLKRGSRLGAIHPW